MILKLPWNQSFHVICPSVNALTNVQLRCKIRPDNRVDSSRITVLVPNSAAAIQWMNDASERAYKILPALKKLREAASMPRVWPTDDILAFNLLVSALNRYRIADCRNMCSDLVGRAHHATKGIILARSPVAFAKTNRQNPRLSQYFALGIQSKFKWSDAALALRFSESAARRATNGAVKTMIRANLLTDELEGWSDTLKAVLVRSFRRNVIEGKPQLVKCDLDCNPEACDQRHEDTTQFLMRSMTGVEKLKRIALILGYLKAKVEGFKKHVLEPQCVEYDFDIKWNRDTWKVDLVGHMWTKKREPLNRNIAAVSCPDFHKEPELFGLRPILSQAKITGACLADVKVVKRLLKKMPEMETCSLDATHLCNTYGLGQSQAEAVVEVARRLLTMPRTYNHPVSLIDMWSPSNLSPSSTELHLKELAIIEAAKCPDSWTALQIINEVSKKLKERGLQPCMDYDPAWKALIRKCLLKVSGMTSQNIDAVEQYHVLLWKTGEGWTYMRNQQEMQVMAPYNPHVLGVLQAQMTASSQFHGEPFDCPLPRQERLDGRLAGMAGSFEDWKEINVLQFLSDTLDKPLTGPTSQDTATVWTSKDVPNWSWVPINEESRGSGETAFVDVNVQELVIRTSKIEKDYENRPKGADPMSYAQFACDYRKLKGQQLVSYKKKLEELGNGPMGPESDKLIAGSHMKAPLFMELTDSSIMKMHSKATWQDKRVIIRKPSQDQSLDSKTKVMLYCPWRRMERDLTQEKVESSDKQACDIRRLQLFPNSTHD